MGFRYRNRRGINKLYFHSGFIAPDHGHPYCIVPVEGFEPTIGVSTTCFLYVYGGTCAFSCGVISICSRPSPFRRMYFLRLTNSLTGIIDKSAIHCVYHLPLRGGRAINSTGMSGL